MERNAVVTLTDQGWTGWVRDAKPNVRTAQVTVHEGEVLSPVTLASNPEEYEPDPFWFYELVVQRIAAEQVCFGYKRLVVKNPGGGINLTAEPSGRFWLWVGRLVELATPTMDGGIIVTVRVDSIA